MEICFWFHGRRFCIYIPLLIWPPWERPGPDPWEKIIEVEGIDRQVIVNVASLAAIETFGKRLQPELRGEVSTLVARGLADINKTLPSEVRIEIPGVGVKAV